MKIFSIALPNIIIEIGTSFTQSSWQHKQLQQRWWKHGRFIWHRELQHFSLHSLRNQFWTNLKWLKFSRRESSESKVKLLNNWNMLRGMYLEHETMMALCLTSWPWLFRQISIKTSRMVKRRFQKISLSLESIIKMQENIRSMEGWAICKKVKDLFSSNSFRSKPLQSSMFIFMLWHLLMNHFHPIKSPEISPCSHHLGPVDDVCKWTTFRTMHTNV